MSQVKQLIKEEVTRQLQLMKRQIDLELRQDIQAVRNELIARIDQVQSTVSDDVNKQLVAADTGVSREMAVAICDNMAQNVYGKIIGELNTTIVPRVNAIMQAQSYHNQDTTELITQYRRAIYDESNGAKAITDGKTATIAPHVSLFFNEDDKYI